MDFDFDFDLKTDIMPAPGSSAKTAGSKVVLDADQRYAVELCIARAELETFAEHVDVAEMPSSKLWDYFLSNAAALKQGDDVTVDGVSPRQMLGDLGNVIPMPDLVFE